MDTLRQETLHLTTTAMADTGCQSCLAGPSLMKALHLHNSDLIPACLVMHSASGTNLPILGVAFLRIKAKISDRETRQMVYFSDIATKLYLSLATCTDLGLIAMGFPFGTPTPPPGNGTGTRMTSDQPLHRHHRTAALQTRTSAPTHTNPPAVLQTRPPVTLQTNPPAALQKIPPVTPQAVNQHSHDPHPRTCSCPTRAPPPDRPTSLPFPGTEAKT